MKKKQKYDLVIIGAGPAGMSAAVYAGRYKLKTLVVGESIGGLAGEAIKICNFLSYKEITGKDFVERMEEQVRNLGIEIKVEKVFNLFKKKKEEDSSEFFEVGTKENIYLAKKIILATGSEKRKLALPKARDFLGKGLSYCAVCDAPFYKNKRVGVLGGGNSALTAALLLSEFAEKVYIFYRREKFFRPEPKLIEAIKKKKNVETFFKVEVKELKGKEKLEGVKLSNQKEITLDGLFVEIGETPNLELALQLGISLEGSFVKVDKEQRTNVKGVFAAGDLTNNPLKQIITAAAEGALAATSVYKEIQKEKEKCLS